MPTDLRDALAEAIVSHEWDDFPRSAHNVHSYYGECAICQEDIPRIAEVALAALAEDPGDVPKRMAAGLREAIDYELTTGGESGLRELVASLEDPGSSALVAAVMSVRDELVAHLAARAAKAEVRVGHAEAGAQLSSERLAKVQQELAEIKRVTDPPTGDEEMPTDPAELREMWEFINRQARWQWHMAHRYGSQVERVRELHSPETDPRRTPDCKGCRTDVSFTYHDRCKTIAALNAETTTTPARETA